MIESMILRISSPFRALLLTEIVGAREPAFNCNFDAFKTWALLGLLHALNLLDHIAALRGFREGEGNLGAGPKPFEAHPGRNLEGHGHPRPL